jgi:hypothetical protein
MRYHEPCANGGQADVDDRIHTAQTEGMEPLVEPTLARWFTEPFRHKGSPVLDQVRTMIRTHRHVVMRAAAMPSPR